MAARSLNKAQIIGNLTRDPELRYTAKGTPICTFGVATNRYYTPVDAAESVEETEFHNVVAWTKLAELCSQLLHKGWKVFIEGRLSTRSWQDAGTGKKMYRTEIVANDMIVLGAPRSAMTAEAPVVVAAAEPAKQTVIEESESDKSPAEVSETASKKKLNEEVTNDEVKDMPF